MMRGGQEAGDPLAATAGLRPESVLSRNRRALVIGNAGSGKTTLLQWLAVRSALGDFSSSLGELERCRSVLHPAAQVCQRDLASP